MVALNITRLPVEREIAFGGGVILTMRRAQGYERAAADQDGGDWKGKFLGGKAALTEVGLADDPTLINRLDMIAGLIILRRALFLFSRLVVAWNLDDADGAPIPLTNVEAVSAWLNLGMDDHGSELQSFLMHAEYGSRAEMSEGNELRPLPNGSGVMALNTVNSADALTHPAVGESEA
jgi:hypothetical protein